MNAYLDPSALLKRYVRERGSERMTAFLADEDVAVVTSRATWAEAMAGIARRRRSGDLADADAATLLDRLECDLRRFSMVDVNEAVTARVRHLVTRLPLRGYDAVHLATALLVAAGRPGQWTFACSDLALCAAADAEGLRVLDPTGTFVGTS